MRAKQKTILILALALILSLALATGYVLARYTVTWEKGFGLHIYPKKDSYVLTAGELLNDKWNTETQHIVFGLTADHADKVEDVEALHVGNEAADLVYLYYVESTKTAYVLAKKEIVFHEDSSGMFQNLSTVQSITFENLTTAKVTDMESMFQGCTALATLDLCIFDTSSAVNMQKMFASCTNLTTVFADRSFVTESVTNSTDMFLEAYVLEGGKGTRVYPVGETTTTQPLDKINAWPDGMDGKAGYFTDKSQMIFFRSNLLRPEGMGQTYTVNGTSAWFTLANGLDSLTVSKEKISYSVSYFIDRGGVWEEVPEKAESKIVAGGLYSVIPHTVAPITVSGETFDRIKVVATAVGVDKPLEAVFEFDYSPMTISYTLVDNVICMKVYTADLEGSFAFTWKNGILPDASDPNGILQAADPAAKKLIAPLNAYTVYEFCFVISDVDLFYTVNADPEAQMPLTVSVEKTP